MQLRSLLFAENSRQKMEGTMKKYFAELVGTFFLVFFGVGTAVITGGVPGLVGIIGIAFAFGLGLVAAAYGIGPISGCHINPAVSMGVWVAGRMKTMDLLGYWVGQFIGATLGAWVIFLIASGVSGGYSIATSGLGQNGFGPGYQGGYSLTSAIVYEFVATMLFVIVILGSTQKFSTPGFAGLVIGLTLVAIHLLGIRITGTSVNPARSFGPAVFAGGQAIQQLWVFLLLPTLGGAAAGLLFRLGVLEVDKEPKLELESLPPQLPGA
jgi:aquaporin Z